MSALHLSRFSFSVALLPSTLLSAAALAVAAAAYCTLVKLASFLTVFLSALEQSPFGTAGYHGVGSILPTGTVLERRELSVWWEMLGHEKVQCTLLNQKHNESKFRKLGGAAWSQEEDDVCHIFKVIFPSAPKRIGCADRTPKGTSGMKGMQLNCAEQEKLCAPTACWVFTLLVWKYFASYSQGKKAQRGEGLVQCNGQTTLPLLESNPLTWVKSILYMALWLNKL